MNVPNIPQEVSPAEVCALRERHEDFLLLDCREQSEYDLVRIKGAVLLPMSELAARVEELAPHRDRPIVVHCHHGGRSLRVAQWLRGQGFAGAQSLRGGIDLWAVEIEPGMARY